LRLTRPFPPAACCLCCAVRACLRRTAAYKRLPATQPLSDKELIDVLFAKQDAAAAHKGGGK
jgi:hypothetical protein